MQQQQQLPTEVFPTLDEAEKDEHKWHRSTHKVDPNGVSKAICCYVGSLIFCV